MSPKSSPVIITFRYIVIYVVTAPYHSKDYENTTFFARSFLVTIEIPASPGRYCKFLYETTANFLYE